MNDFGDHVPLGHSLGPGEGWKQYNYLLRSGSTAGDAAYRWMGLLYLHGGFDSPEAFFCPEESEPLISFDTEDNPWPPDASAPAGKSTRVGYGTRPLLGWPFPRSRPLPSPMPRLSGVADVALLADLLHKPDRIELRHETGLNATYGHGGASWVPLEAIAEVEVGGVRWRDTLGAGFDTAFNDVFLKDAPKAADREGVWAELDRF